MAEKLESPPPLEIYYMRLTANQADARLGKLQEGDVVPMDKAKATRWLTAGVAVQASEGEYRDKMERKADRATAQQNAFRATQQQSDVWDVSTYRDVMTAPEGGLRLAHERGIPLVNVHMLRDEDGDPLAPDADIEDILDARQNLHPDLQAPFAAHERSSVMGGGSPYTSNMASGGGPMPLSPQHRIMQERIAQQEVMAQRAADFSYDRDNPDAKTTYARGNQERQNRANRRSAQRSAAPEPKASPEAPAAAKDAGVEAPKEKLDAGQRAN